jgi:hypothetical protein
MHVMLAYRLLKKLEFLIFVGIFIPGFRRFCTNGRFYQHKTYDRFCPRFEDHAINPELEKRMAKRANAKMTILKSSPRCDALQTE